MRDPWNCLCDYETVEPAPTGDGLLSGLSGAEPGVRQR